jgi:hypothetical protein
MLMLPNRPVVLGAAGAVTSPGISKFYQNLYIDLTKSN